jgi:hypothetical protein
MNLLSLPQISEDRTTVRHRSFDPLCLLCTQPVSLENSKTEEHGLAIHEECYVLSLTRQRPRSEGASDDD